MDLEGIQGTIPAFAWRDWEKTMKNLSQDSQSLGWDLNSEPENKAGVLNTRP
jgi:hypothetical protein